MPNPSLRRHSSDNCGTDVADSPGSEVTKPLPDVQNSWGADIVGPCCVSYLIKMSQHPERQTYPQCGIPNNRGAERPGDGSAVTQTSVTAPGQVRPARRSWLGSLSSRFASLPPAASLPLPRRSHKLQYSGCCSPTHFLGLMGSRVWKCTHHPLRKIPTAAAVGYFSFSSHPKITFTWGTLLPARANKYQPAINPGDTPHGFPSF